MKERLLLLALFGVLHSNAGAQNSLEPCQGDFSDEYHAGVNRVINDAVVNPSSIQLTTFPSFRPELFPVTVLCDVTATYPATAGCGSQARAAAS
jgi:hypothetical protein